jgi:hypothetical protein
MPDPAATILGPSFTLSQSIPGAWQVPPAGWQHTAPQSDTATGSGWASVGTEGEEGVPSG